MPQIILDDPDGTLGMLRDSVAQFASRVDGPAAMRTRRDAGLGLDRKIWDEMAQAGWLGLTLPETMGGAGLGLQEQTILSEALGRALITEPLAQLSVFAGTLLATAPDNAEALRLSQGLLAGSLVVSPVWQDINGAAGAVSLSGVPDNLLLNGTADLVCAGLAADVFLVLARDERKGNTALLSVPADAAGVRIAERPTVDGASLARVDFVDCAVEAGNVLARDAAVENGLAAAIEATRLTLAAELAGVGARALELTVGYTKERVQFGKQIASFQTIQHRLVDMWSMAEFACAAIVNALEQLEDAATAPAGTMAVLAAKARAGDAAVDITRRAIHLHGAMGFTDECDIGLYMKRAVNLNATLGNAQALRLQFVALERAS
jgi:alkylation response protein AidB-like acyl-CoA dehydrogenase